MQNKIEIQINLENLQIQGEIGQWQISILLNITDRWNVYNIISSKDKMYNNLLLNDLQSNKIMSNAMIVD